MGDDLYGVKSDFIGRHALHCTATCFPHPEDGKEMLVRSPVPEDIGNLLMALGYDLAETERLCGVYCDSYYSACGTGKENDLYDTNV